MYIRRHHTINLSLPRLSFLGCKVTWDILPGGGFSVLQLCLASLFRCDVTRAHFQINHVQALTDVTGVFFVSLLLLFFRAGGPHSFSSAYFMLGKALQTTDSVHVGTHLIAAFVV